MLTELRAQERGRFSREENSLLANRVRIKYRLNASAGITRKRGIHPRPRSMNKREWRDEARNVFTPAGIRRCFVGFLSNLRCASEKLESAVTRATISAISSIILQGKNCQS